MSAAEAEPASNVISLPERAPQIISSYDPGIHNTNLPQTIERLDQEVSWKDLSTIMVTPASGSIATRVVASWESLIYPPNNRIVRLTAIGVEVGEAYSRCIESILSHEQLSTWTYLCTREHDNLPPQDGLVKLLRRMEAHPEYAAISGLYFTKGAGGCAQIWGDPTEHPLNFRPQKPALDGGLVECNGIGMGWAVYRLAMFKDPRLAKPWFRTKASREEGVGTQDLTFWANARMHGYRCAVDCGVKTGHYDAASDTVW